MTLPSSTNAMSFPESTSSLSTIPNVDSKTPLTNPPTGSVLSGWSVMANTMVGTGVLGLASAFAQTGWILGGIMMFTAALFAVFTLHLLNHLSMRSQTQKVSFYTAAESVAPWAKWIVDLTIIVKCFGVAVSYLQVAGDMLSMLIIFWTGTSMSTFVVRALVITVTTLLMAPVCMAKDLKSTNITNIIAIVTIAYCVILGVCYADFDSGNDSVGIPDTASMASILAKLPTFIFAFTCHQNMFIVAEDMKDRSQKKLDIVALASELTAVLIFLPAVIFPYGTFGSEVATNFLQNLTMEGQIAVQIGYLFLSIGVMCSYTLQIVPSTKSCIVLLTKGRELQNARKAKIMHYVVSICCQVIPMITAISVSSLGVTFSFVGILGSNTICYIMPTFLYCMMVKVDGKAKDWKFWCAAGLCVVALLLVPICVGSLIQQIIAGDI